MLTTYLELFSCFPKWPLFFKAIFRVYVEKKKEAKNMTRTDKDRYSGCATARLFYTKMLQAIHIYANFYLWVLKLTLK